MKQSLYDKENKKKIEDMMSCIKEPEGMKNSLLELKQVHRKRNISRWLVPVTSFMIVLFLGTGTYAATKHWKFTDFFTAEQVSEKANDIVVTEIKSSDMENRNENEYGNEIIRKTDIKLEESLSFNPTLIVNDGELLYIGFEAEIKENSDYFLIHNDINVDDPVCLVMKNTDSNQSIKDYCAEKGKTIVLVEGDIPANSNVVRMTSERNSSVSMTKVECLLEGVPIGDSNRKEVQVVYKVSLYNAITDSFVVAIDKTQNLGIPEKVKNEVAQYGFESRREKRIGNTSIFIEKVTLTSTPIATYAEFYVRNEDDKYGNWVSVQMVNKSHQLLEKGPGNSGFASVPRADGSFTVKTDYAKMEKLPDEIRVRAYNLPLENEELPTGFIKLRKVS